MDILSEYYSVYEAAVSELKIIKCILDLISTFNANFKWDTKKQINNFRTTRLNWMFVQIIITGRKVFPKFSICVICIIACFRFEISRNINLLIAKMKQDPNERRMNYQLHRWNWISFGFRIHSKKITQVIIFKNWLDNLGQICLQSVVMRKAWVT